MKRLQILLDDALNAKLERLASEQGTALAELMRELVRDRAQTFPSITEDPIYQLAAADDLEPVAVDDIIYK